MPDAPGSPENQNRPVGPLQRHDRPAAALRDPRRDLVPGRVERRPRRTIPDSLPRDDQQLARRTGGRETSRSSSCSSRRSRRSRRSRTRASWAELREAQRLTTANGPQDGDGRHHRLGDEEDIHPRKKEPVGRRLALAARARRCMASGSSPPALPTAPCEPRATTRAGVRSRGPRTGGPGW